MRRCALALVCLLALSCSRLSPEPVSGTVQMLVLAYDPPSGTYKLVIGDVTTLHDLRTLSGDAAKILGGAEISVNYDQLDQQNPQTAEEIQNLTTVHAGSPVDFAYFTVDGIIHPEDFDSLCMATLYFNFEQAHLYFANLNAALYDLPVLYFAKYSEGTTGHMQTLTDNAFWDSITRQFVVLPFKNIKALPMGMNVGIVAHEYTHAVFDQQFNGSQDGIPWLTEKASAEPDRYQAALNLERSLNEGLADFFGAMVSGDPAFMRKSDSQITDDRRLDPPDPRCYTEELKGNLEDESIDKYDPYPVGSVLSAALWAIASNAGNDQQAFAQGVVDGMTALGQTFQKNQDQTTVADAIDALASTASPDDLKPDECGILLDRFHLTAAEVPHCGESRPPEQTCP